MRTTGALGLGLAMLVALILRLFHLGYQSLWVDEIFSWRAASPHGSFNWGDFFINTHGPLIAALSHGLIRVLGDAEWALRLPFAFASVLLVPAIAFLTKRAAGPRAFLWAAWLVSLSPLVNWYGQEMRNYAFAFLWSALACERTLAYRENGKYRDLALVAVWSALGLLTNLNAIMLVPILFGALLVSPPQGRKRVFPLVLALVGIGTVLLPWAIQYLHLLELQRLVPGRAALPDETPLRGATTFAWAAIPYTFFVDAVGYTLGPSLRSLHEMPPAAAIRPHLMPIAATGLVFGVLLGSGAWSLRGRRFTLALLLSVLLLPLMVVSYFAIMNFKTFNARYASSGLPAWFVLVAAGFVAVSVRARIVLATGALLLCLASLRNHYFDPAYGKEDFRATAAFLKQEVAPSDSVVATGGYAPIEYYLPGRYRVYWLGFAQDQRMAPKFEPFVNRNGGATWVVVSRTQESDPSGRFERWLQTTYRPQVTTFPGVRVYRIAASDSLSGPPR